MRVPRKFDREEGLLSLDFLIGFTIFLIALIFVGVMISGLLVHLQSRTIDYDAVAYRTSVVLLEDPGEPANWQLANLTYPEERANVKRLGLAIQKNYPCIVSKDKVEKFFNSSTGCLAEGTFCTPDDYREKIIFGDYPYHFHISMKYINDTLISPQPIGDPLPDPPNYGFIKRVVKIQIPDESVPIFNVTSDNQSSMQSISFRFNISELDAVPSPYRIDPLSQNVSILLQNFQSNEISSYPNITDIQICTYPVALTGGGCIGADVYDDYPQMIVTIDGTQTYNSEDLTPDTVTNNVLITLQKGFFTRIGYDRFGIIDLILTFDQNVTNEEYYGYNYSAPANLSPVLEPAVLEVYVW